MNLKLDSLIGKKFGKWLILSIKRSKYPSGKPCGHFLCRCECGTEKYCATYDITRGKTKQCPECKYKESQKRFKDLTEKTFNKWTVVKLNSRKTVKKDGYRKLIWECRCKCGRLGLVQGSNLTQNLSKGCGLCDEDKQLEYRLVKKLHASKGYRKWLELDETIDGKFLIDLFKKQNEKCALSGVPIHFGETWHRHGTASLDRRDNDKGYVKDNIQWVHKDVNKMKHAFKQENFLDFCRKIAENNPK